MSPGALGAPDWDSGCSGLGLWVLRAAAGCSGLRLGLRVRGAAAGGARAGCLCSAVLGPGPARGARGAGPGPAALAACGSCSVAEVRARPLLRLPAHPSAPGARARAPGPLSFERPPALASWAPVREDGPNPFAREVHVARDFSAFLGVNNFTKRCCNAERYRFRPGTAKQGRERPQSLDSSPGSEKGRKA